MPEQPDTPQPDETGEPPPDLTLGGYMALHKRPPAFGGNDGQPYTVSPEVERTGDLRLPCAGYLVFPRWAETGVGIVGHVETGTLVKARSEEEATAALGRLTLLEVRRLLDEAVDRAITEPT